MYYIVDLLIDLHDEHDDWLEDKMLTNIIVVEFLLNTK